MKDISLENSDFEHANFDGVYWDGKEQLYRNLSLDHCKFNNATLQNVDFINANLSLASFSQ